MTLLYKATNTINQKPYFGITDYTLRERRNGHHSDTNQGSKLKFHRAIRKHGRDAFLWEIVAVYDSREEAADAERIHIAEHDTFNNGYNSTNGGEIGFIFTEEVKASMRKPRSEQTKANMSAAKIGTRLSAEHRANIGKGNLGSKRTKTTCRRMSITHSCPVIIENKYYQSGRDAAKAYCVSNGTISNWIKKGKAHHA